MMRSTFRRIAIFAGVLTLGTQLVACGAGTESASNTSGTPSADSRTIEEAKATVAKLSGTQEFVIEPLPTMPSKGKVIAQVNCTIPQCGAGELDEPAAALGWTVDKFEFDMTKGAQDYLRAVDAAIASKPDYLWLVMNFGKEVVARQLATAKSQGIPVIGVGGGTAGDDVAVMIQNSQTLALAGEYAADVALADAGGASVHVAVPLDPSTPSLVDMAGGVKDRLAEDPSSKTDVIELSFAQPAPANATGIINYLQAHPDTRYVLFPGGAFYAGVQQALQAAGLADKVKLVLMYPYPGTDTQAIKNGEFLASIAGEYSHEWRSIDAMARLSVNEALPTKDPLGAYRILTKDSVSEAGFNPPNFKEVYKSAWGY